MWSNLLLVAVILSGAAGQVFGGVGHVGAAIGFGTAAITAAILYVGSILERKGGN